MKWNITSKLLFDRILWLFSYYSTTNFADTFAAGFVLAEMISNEVKSQIAGVALVADASGFGFKQVRNFGVSDAKVMAAFLTYSFPLWFRSIHVVNAPKVNRSHKAQTCNTKYTVGRLVEYQ